ncbi:MAG: SufD family Fe-S cluster assembly protein [Coriobacteriales bacterium]|nr:SufD family Fe-S cluster assembly protein [Coriobacteriales bacterium]
MVAQNLCEPEASLSKVILTCTNELPSPTWNHLNINGINLKVPAVEGFDEQAWVAPKIRPKRDVPAYNVSDDHAFDAPEGTAAPAGPWARESENSQAAKPVGGMGPAATAWLEAAGKQKTIVVEATGDGTKPLYVVDLDDPQVGELAVLDINVQENAQAELVLISSNRADTAAALGTLDTRGWLVRVNAADGARVKINEFIACDSSVQMLSNLGFCLANGATADISQYCLGSQILALGCAADLVGKSAALNVDARYVGRGTEQLDFGYSVRNRGVKTVSNLSLHGVLVDEANKSLRSTIDLVHGAKGASGVENESVVLVGEGVVNKTLPVILCNEDDVAGTHGASVGEIDPSQLAYMATRGITSDDARELMMEATYSAAFAAAQHIPQAYEAVYRAACRAFGEDIAQELAADLEGGLS